METATLVPPLAPVRTVRGLGLPVLRGQEADVDRVLGRPLEPGVADELRRDARCLGVTDELAHVVRLFATPPGHTPPGFAVTAELEADGTLRFGLRRDISYDADGALRPTGQLFSVDSANPYEIAPVAPLVANLTCNPSIIWDLFLSDPAKNVGGAFKDRDDVMTEIARILGPGADMSLELEDPFDDVERVLDEAEHLRELVTPYRCVIKVPHTGPVNAANAPALLEGDGHLDVRYDEPATADAFRGHDLALRLRERGFRINFTLMFEPYQVRLALQARPYFVNAFVRHRMFQSQRMAALLDEHAPGTRLLGVAVQRVEQLHELRVVDELLDLARDRGRRDRQAVRLGQLLLEHGEHQAGSSSVCRSSSRRAISSASLRDRSACSPSSSSTHTRWATAPKARTSPRT